MKELFDRHAEALTSSQRQHVWRNISRAHAMKSQPRVHWAIPATAATLAAGVITVAVMRQEPNAPAPTRAASPDASASSIDTRVEERTTATPPAAAQAPIKHRVHPAEPVAKQRVYAFPESLALLAARPAPAAIPSTSAPASAPSPIATGKVTGVVTDAAGQPVPFANVMLQGFKIGTLSDEQGRFELGRVPVGITSLRVQALGYETRALNVQSSAESTVTVNVALGNATVAKTLETFVVGAERRIDTKSSSTKQNISAERLRSLPVDNLNQLVRAKSGVVAQGEALHLRGGRSGDVKFQVDGAPLSTSNAPHIGPAPATPPVVPTTGGIALPNDEAYDSMFFKNYGVNPFIATDEDRLSTFAVDVDAGSYTLMRRYLELGHLPPADAVRVEEFVNFFPQGYPQFDNEDFRILVDGAPSPFGRDYQLLRIGIKGREIADHNRKPAHLTFVIDVSGSMAREDRLELVKQALHLLVGKLHDDDRVGIVIYGTRGQVLLEPTALEDGRREILGAIDRLFPEGSTNAEEGISLGYEVARRNFEPKAINRIVLCSDGVANVGRTGPQSILERARTEADHGVHLSTVGFGMGNYNDVLMEQLADKGDGNYYYVDDLREARRVFEENLTGTLQTIAKDAKVQVEFDSSRVLRYRLLGFENRAVADRDFRNDRVDAGEIGAGHEVTALYELKLAPRQQPGPLATIRFRYARPEHEGSGAPEVREITKGFISAELSRRFEDASANFRLDAAAAEFAELLRGSYWAKDGRYSGVLSVVRSASRQLGGEAARELVSLVEKAAQLKRSNKDEEPK